MARRKKSDDIAAFFLFIIGVILAVIYIASWAAIFIYVAMFLYYWLTRKHDISLHIEDLKSIHSQYTSHNTRHREEEKKFIGLRTTQQGYYDERSYAGKDANSFIARSNQRSKEITSDFQEIAGPFNRYIFVKWAIFTYAATMALLLMCANLNYKDDAMTIAPVISLITSAIAGFIAKSLQGLSVDNPDISDLNISKNETSNIICLIFSIVACFISLNLFIHMKENIDASSKNQEQPISSETKPQTQTNNFTVEPFSDFYEIPEESGFIIKESDLRRGANLQSNVIAKIPSGHEITFKGRSPDGKWYKILYIDENGKHLSGFVFGMNTAKFSIKP